MYLQTMFRKIGRKKSKQLVSSLNALNRHEKTVQMAKAYFDQVFEFFIKTTQLKSDQHGCLVKAEKMIQKASKKLTGFVYSMCDGESKSQNEEEEDKPKKKKRSGVRLSVSDEESTVVGQTESGSDQATGEPSDIPESLSEVSSHCWFYFSV